MFITFIIPVLFLGTQPSSQMSKCLASSLRLSWVLRGPRGVIPHKVGQLGPRSPHAPSLREESSERSGQLWGLQLRPPAPSRVKRPLRPRVGLTLSTDPSLGKEASALHPNSLLAPRLASSPSCHPQEAPPHPKSLYTGAVPARVCVSGVCMRDVGDLNM